MDQNKIEAIKSKYQSDQTIYERNYNITNSRNGQSNIGPNIY